MPAILEEYALIINGAIRPVAALPEILMIVVAYEDYRAVWRYLG